MFQYEFMQKAFIIGILLSIIIPCIGVVVVLKRLSMIGDALSHTSLAGVANLFIKYIENKSQLNDKLFSDIKKEYDPDYILLEYNGTWELSELLKLKKPIGYKIRNVITVADGSVFENYMFNMTKLMWDKISNSDRVVFNRFDQIPSEKRDEFRTAIIHI